MVKMVDFVMCVIPQLKLMIKKMLKFCVRMELREEIK